MSLALVLLMSQRLALSKQTDIGSGQSIRLNYKAVYMIFYNKLVLIARFHDCKH